MLRNFSPGFGNLDPGAVPGRSGERCLHDLFDAVAARRGSAPAAMDHGRTISYEELKARSDRLARRLYKAGVSHGDRVGVSGGRSLDALVAFLGILKVGAAYLPLDDTSPPRRLQAMRPAHEKRILKQIPQTGQGVTDGGLRHAQSTRRLGRAPGAGQLSEYQEQASVEFPDIVYVDMAHALKSLSR